MLEINMKVVCLMNGTHNNRLCSKDVCVVIEYLGMENEVKSDFRRFGMCISVFEC